MPSNRLQLRMWLRALDGYERRLLVKASRQRKAFIKKAAEQYEKAGEIPAWLVKAHRAAIRTTLEAHYRVVMPHFGNMVLKQIKSVPYQRKAAFNLMTAKMLEWISTEALRKAQMVADTDMDDVRGAIERGIQDGVGQQGVAALIREKAALSTFRAATLARTETHNAATYGSLETARNSETEFDVKLVKLWQPTLDDRTRDDHRNMEGQPGVALDEQFRVGGAFMDRPGDNSAPPEQVINCRCALAYREK
jgi:hypothetical protein